MVKPASVVSKIRLKTHPASIRCKRAGDGETHPQPAFTFNYTRIPAFSTFTAKPTLPVAAFDADSPGTSIEQSTGATLDDLADRLMNRVGYRNLGTLASPTHSFVLNWTVNVSSGAGTTAATYTGGSRW